MLRQTLVRFLSVAVMVMTASGAWAAELNKPRSAATDLSQVDADFALQGEYNGSVLKGRSPVQWQDVGLQVIARGGGRFDAVEYTGGLPGDSWNRKDRIKLSGSRHGDALWLTGPGRRVLVENDIVLIYHAGDMPVGQLAKTQRISGTLEMLPPTGSIVLFDGYGTRHFQGARLTNDYLLKQGTQTKDAFGNYILHVEFRLPYMPYARGQARGNSGVYLQSRYEVQLLDSFGLEGRDNECGGLYKLRKPDVNMCLPPLSWQTYDIAYRAPRFDKKGKKKKDARLTVWHNGVLIHNRVRLKRKTGGGAAEGPTPLSIKLQDHHNPVRFRNIWLVKRTAPKPLPKNLPAQSWFGEYTASDGSWKRVEFLGPPVKRAYWLY